MRINKDQPIYIRLMVAGLVVFFGVLTIIASGPTKTWVKPGGTVEEFNKDKYSCMKENEQRVSGAYVGPYGGSSSSKVIVNWDLFNACMNARGWSLQQQSN